jgi:hypothetical protein
MNKIISRIRHAGVVSKSAQKSLKGGDGGIVQAPCKQPKDYACLDVYAPVICSDGGIYSNGCYASLACQYNCQPYGGDTI